MKRYFILFIYISLFSIITSAQHLTLEQCQQMAIDNFSLTQQKQLLQDISELSLQRISNNQLPKISVNAQVTYQSDVTGLPIEIPGQSIPEIPKTQYRATLDIQQSIYTGGLTKHQKNIEQANLRAEQQKIEIAEHVIKERINQLYYGILLLDENINLVTLLKQELADKMTAVESGVRNGIANENQLNELKAALINVEQKEIEISHNRSALLQVLLLLTNQPTTTVVELIKPAISNYSTETDSSRPELELFRYQSNVLEASKGLTSVALQPKAFAFAQAGIGRPGLNFLDDQAQGFYIVGLKLKWDLWDWNSSNFTKQQLSIRQNIIKTQEHSFNTNTDAALGQKQIEIDKLEKLINKDSELVALRSSIKDIASKQLTGGIITTTDYITKLNEENKAKLNNKVHVMELELAKANYLTILGKEIN